MLRTCLLASSISLAVCACAQTNCNEGAGPLDSALPDSFVPDKVVRAFAGNEALFEQARKNYGYTQDLHLQTLSSPVTAYSRRRIDNRVPPRNDNGEFVTGEFRQVSEITYDSQGKRVERVTYAPQNTLRSTSLTREDFEDIQSVSGFILTPNELPRYDVRYAGQQHVDELDTYAFEVSPVRIKKGERYFEGRIWVEAHDLVVVKTCGRRVPDQPGDKHHQANLSPKFVTYRELIDGKYWFPTYTRADDVLPFARNPVHIHETVKFTAYRRIAPAETPSGQDAARDPARNRQSSEQPPSKK
jgi:hypothetical protein